MDPLVAILGLVAHHQMDLYILEVQEMDITMILKAMDDQDMEVQVKDMDPREDL